MSAHATANEIFDLYTKYGAADYIGEPVSQLEHMSQSAQLAIDAGADDEVILAAFFHDIGHICVQEDPTRRMGTFGNKSHEEIGANFLKKKGFSDRLAQLVENHVKAKRYLTWKDPNYYQQLSEASKNTLEYQGGMMTEEEAHEFEQEPLFADSIRLRRWDEAAKETGKPVIDLELLKIKTVRVLMRPSGSM
jgi:2-amino-1-hydroxyethylphosphonate dioxygenase (glycine-forming)